MESKRIDEQGTLVLWNRVKSYVNGITSSIDNTKMDKENPTSTGSFSLNRKADTTIGDYSHAEGYETIASADYSHAEGNETIASGNYSHAEGWTTTASGKVSHVEGWETIASSNYQHVQGKYNLEDTENRYAHIVGNGNAYAPSNAHTLDWSGNAWFAGTVTDGDGHILSNKADSVSPKISTSIELHGTTPYIDFHFNNDQGDYTSRIIESASGTLNVVGNLQVNGTAVSLSGHTHSYAGSSSAGGAATSANKVNKNLIVKLNSGSTEGTNLFTFNGSTAKTVNITPSAIGAQATITGAATTVTSSNLTASRALVSNSSGKIAVSAVTSTELGYLDGVTSPIQIQLTNLGSRITNSTNILQDSLDSHTHSTLTNSDGAGKVSLILDGDYYYLRPHSASMTYCGSSTRPWYKIFTERLEVSKAKPQFTYIGSDGGGSTVSYATNLYVGSTGLLSRSTNTSSRTIKHDIKELQDEQICAERLYDVNIYQAKYNADILDEADDRYLKDLPMFIIEDLDEKYPIVIDKPSDNVKEWSWNPQYIIPSMLKLIQDQKKKIDELETRLQNLEA